MQPSSSKQDILKRYISRTDDDANRKKKRKKATANGVRKHAKPAGVRIVDDTFSVASNARDDADADDDDDAPTVAERTEERRETPWLGTKADGSGWVAVDYHADVGAGGFGRSDAADLSPPRRRALPAASAADLSPPRRGRHDSPDLSPPRRTRHDSPDLSPPRKPRHDSAADLSPPRRSSIKREPSIDLSPHRRRPDADLSPPRRREADPGREDQPALATGLLSRTQLRADLDLRRKHQEGRLDQMSEEQMGRTASTVFRDSKTGKRMSMSEVIRQQKEAAGLAADDVDEERGMQWGKGLVQAKMADDKAAYEAHEAAKPFARMADDEDLNAALREQHRWGDPMARLLSKGSGKEERKAKKEKKGKKEKKAKDPKILGLRCKFAGPPNRFGIPPGHRWDGVDRSTGYERKLFEKQSSNVAFQDQKYLWSVEDM
eukprot:TRINITY_DN8953_c2_g1_i7.p1 TRINITY_DN8953_c2_g1~~TRINITY_DN8953_c2_g1_i7.p1  ORF type:complete len:434 (+),score=84.39 TRINITY_DN8953_c2_g1_i7:985-2286(+)